MSAKWCMVKIGLSIALMTGCLWPAAGNALPVRAAGDPVWQPMGRSGLPDFGSLLINVIVAHPTKPGVIYLGTGPSYGKFGGVYRTLNGGESWEAVNTGLPEGAIIDLMAISPDGGMLYARSSSYQDGGFFRSPTGSFSWTKLESAPVDDYAGIFSIYAGEDAVFAGMYGSGIYKSSDQGDSWRHLDHSPQNTVHFITGVSSHKDLMYAASVDVYQSSDAGEQWDHLDGYNLIDCASGYTDAIAVDPISPDTVFAGDDNACLERSSDGGKTWNVVYKNVGVNHVLVDPHDDQIVYMSAIHVGAFHDGVMKSVDNGKTWSDFNDGLPFPETVGFSLGPGADGKTSVLYAGTAWKGVYTTAPAIPPLYPCFLPVVVR